jgi:hypothetical protein
MWEIDRELDEPKSGIKLAIAALYCGFSYRFQSFRVSFGSSSDLFVRKAGRNWYGPNNGLVVAARILAMLVNPTYFQ